LDLVNFTSRLDEFILRLDKIEYVVELSGKKPRIFTEIEDKLVDGRVQLEVTKTGLLHEIAKVNSRVD
jgi:hypothetical protein